jgi:hypothetical protein
MRITVGATILAACGCGSEASNAVPSDAIAEVDSVPDAESDAAMDDTADAEIPIFDVGREVSVDSEAEGGKPTCSPSQLEPNDSLATARPLPEVNDCDGSGGGFHGVVAGGMDSDYWTFRGNDKSCVVDPTVTNHSASIRVCAFPQCVSGATAFKKCSRGTAAKLPSGLNGCCVDGVGDATVDFSCSSVGFDDSADIFIRVDSPGAEGCLPYDVEYHF